MEPETYIDFCTKFYEALYRRRRKDTSVVQILGNLYAQTGNRKASIKMDKRHVLLAPENPAAHYNLACDLSINGKTEAAIQELEIAIHLGYNDLQWIHDDIDLDPIRQHSGFKKLISENFVNSSKQ